MSDTLRQRIFEPDNRVRVIGPVAERYLSKIGVIRDLYNSGGVYRYIVEFEDGVSDTFFGFELKMVEPPVA